MFNWLVAAVRAAFIGEVKSMVTDKLKEEARKLLDALGVAVEELTEETAQKVVEWKRNHDAETRRVTRVVWGVAGFIVGAIVTYVVMSMF